jgi:hypothetical protein
MPTVHAMHIPSTIPVVPFVLEGLFCEADADAMDAKPDLELAANAMGMDVENNAKGAAATRDGGMIVDDDGAAANNVGTLSVFQPTYPSRNS